MHVINTKELSRSKLREHALVMIEAGLDAVDTQNVVRSRVSLNGDNLLINSRSFSLSSVERLFVVAVGKAALDASIALEEVLGGRLTGGVLLDIAPLNSGPLDKIEYLQGDHPMPTQRNVDATRRILDVLEGLTECDMVLVVVSGGGSTLLCQPNNATCEDEKALLKTLFKVGATIQEINTVRKHTSGARGGNLAKAAHPAEVISLIFSDVPGDDLQFIASGPTVRDVTTIADAEAVLKKYVITEGNGVSLGSLMETPKEDCYFHRVTNVLFLSNRVALDAMGRVAKERGFSSRIVATDLSGEARDVGKKIAMELRSVDVTTALFYGGETTVTIRGEGRGGRNQELALGALKYLGNGELIASVASDGHDNTDYAGALCDIITMERAKEAGLDVDEFLKENDSYTFFTKVGDGIKTGLTGSNVSDIVIALKE